MSDHLYCLVLRHQTRDLRKIVFDRKYIHILTGLQDEPGHRHLAVDYQIVGALIRKKIELSRNLEA